MGVKLLCIRIITLPHQGFTKTKPPCLKCSGAIIIVALSLSLLLVYEEKAVSSRSSTFVEIEK
jgi:hypothetical protein